MILVPYRRKVKLNFQPQRAIPVLLSFSVYLKLFLSQISNLKIGSNKERSRKLLPPWAEFCLSWYFASLVFHILSSWNSVCNWLFLLFGLSPPLPTPCRVNMRACRLQLPGTKVFHSNVLGLRFGFLSGSSVVEMPWICIKNALVSDHAMNSPNLLPHSASDWDTFFSLILLVAFVVLHIQFASHSLGNPSFMRFLLARQDLVLLVSASIIIYCLTLSPPITL